MWAKAVDVSKYFMRTYEIKPGAVIGHWEAQDEGGMPKDKQKTCPGLKFDMKAFRKAVSDEI
jgi:N-acetyl-anhydromuramyl-L-alanine amidase AmpD